VRRDRRGVSRFVEPAAAFLVALVVISSPLLDKASASPALAKNAAADCSKQTATQLVNQHELNNFLLNDPVQQVLCGSFTGPGSEAMALTIAAPTCWGIQRWAVFRFDGSAWQLVLDRNDWLFPPLVAVGGDIQATSPVFRPTDTSRCGPTGGKRSRIWHWDGTRFVAGVWKQVEPGAVETIAFYSPSENLYCVIGDNRNLHGANCWSFNAPRVVRMNAAGGLRICQGRRCFKDCGCREEAPVLAYGKQLTVGRFRCVSLRSGIKCTVVQLGRGFLISRSAVQRIG
jgi:hypothetical protein